MNARLPPARPRRWGAALALLVGVMVSACGSVQPDLAGTAVAEEPLTTQASVVALGAVIINEIGLGPAAQPVLAEAADPAGRASAWVELVNPGNLSVDLAGFGLSNSAAQPFRWTFPAGTTIEPGQRLRVWLSGELTSKLPGPRLADRGAALHANFAVEADLATGRVVVPMLLSTPNGAAEGLLLDRTLARLEGADARWCRTPNGDAAAAFHQCAGPTSVATTAVRTAQRAP